MKRTVLYLTRHGQTEWNVVKRLQGHQDSPLTELGVKQAGWLGEALSDIEFEAIYSSSSPRTIRTAEIIRGARNVEIIKEDDLREINMGSWEGQLSTDIEAQFPRENYAYRNTPHLYEPVNRGESFYDLQNRLLPKIREIVSKHEGKNVLIVTHGVSLKVIMASFGGRPLSELWIPPIIHPTALCKVMIEGDKQIVELNGDTSHYKDGVH
jgi:broad specificity phosphatase PhoE